MATEVEEKEALIKKVMNSTEFNSEEKLLIIKALMKEDTPVYPYGGVIYNPTYVPPYEPQKVWYGDGDYTDPYKITCYKTTTASSDCSHHGHKGGRK